MRLKRPPSPDPAQTGTLRRQRRASRKSSPKRTQASAVGSLIWRCSAGEPSKKRRSGLWQVKRRRFCSRWQRDLNHGGFASGSAEGRQRSRGALRSVGRSAQPKTSPAAPLSPAIVGSGATGWKPRLDLIDTRCGIHLPERLRNALGANLSAQPLAARCLSHPSPLHGEPFLASCCCRRQGAAGRHPGPLNI